MYDEHVNIKTPEYVSLQFQPAGLGSRSAALMIDQALLIITNALIFITLFIVMVGKPNLFNITSLPSYVFGFAIVAIFIINWGYFFALEYFWGGKTIGKRVLGIRVLQENGHSVTLLSCFIRNLLRVIDSLPALYFIGIVMIFLHPKHKRIGDLVAGTLVVHERRVKRKKKETPIEREMNRRGLHKGDLLLEEWELKQLGEKEWNLLKVYSNRLLQLPSEQKYLRTMQLSNLLLPKLGLEVDKKSYEELENTLLVLYLVMKDEWEFEL